MKWSEFSGLLNLWSPTPFSIKIKFHSKESKTCFLFSVQGSFFSKERMASESAPPLLRTLSRGPDVTPHPLTKRPPQVSDLCCVEGRGLLHHRCLPDSFFSNGISSFAAVVMYCTPLICGHHHLEQETW